MKEAIIESINRNCLYKREGWFKRYMSKGYFCDFVTDPERINSYIDIMEGMVKILDRSYKGNWSFVFHRLDNLPSIHILYPEIEIRNSENEKHTIRDLVVVIDLSIGLRGRILIDNRIRGFRLTVTKEEFISGYAHSHLHSLHEKYNAFFNGGEISSNYFCTGENEIPELVSVFNDNQDLGTFELFLLTLDTMMSWESIEGRPYIYLRDISSYSTNRKRLYVESYEDANNIFNMVLRSGLLKRLKYDTLGNRIRVVENDYFIKELYKIVFKENPLLFCKREGEDFYKVYLDEQFLKPIKYSYVFKNTVKPFKIYNNRPLQINLVNENVSSEFMLFPSTYKKVINKINRYLYEKCVGYYETVR